MEQRRSLHGRRKGKPLSRAAHRPAWRRLPARLPSISPRRRREPLAALFPVPVADVRLEIGFGGGEHLIAEAMAAPDTGFIGVEPFVERHGEGGRGDRRRRAPQRPPLRRRCGASPRLAARRRRSTRVDLLYPDPWPKRRHWKRRFVSPENLDRIARVLTPGRPVPLRERHRRLHRVDAPAPHAPRRTSPGRPSAPTTGGSRFPAGRARATRRRRSPPGGGRPISRSGGRRRERRDGKRDTVRPA